MRQFNLRVPLAGAALLLVAAATPAGRIEQDGLVADGLDPAAPALRASWMRYRDGGALRLLDWLADGTLLVAVPGAGELQAARIVAPLAAPAMLGAVPGSVTDAAAHPFDAHRIALRSVDGRGRGVLSLLDAEPGEAPPAAGMPAADPPAADAPDVLGTPLWAHDGRRLAYARERAGGGSSVRIAMAGDPAGGHVVLDDGGRWQVLDWSRDDRSLLLRRELEAGDARLYIADVASGVLTPVDAPAGRRPGPARVPAARFAPDGGAVLYLRDDGEDGYLRLKSAALDGSPPRVLSAAMPHDVEQFDVSADGRYLAWSWAEEGYSRVAVIDQRAHAPLPLPAELAAGVIARLRFDRGGTRLALELSAATTPVEIGVVDVAAGSWSRWAQGPAAGGTLRPAQRLRFRTWDRSGGRSRELAAFLYAPAGAGPHPVLVLLHDGPAGEFRPGYDAWLQFVVNELGFAVVTPNLRGSGGAGRAFAALADGPLRDDATRDIGSLLVWVGAQPALDATRVAIMGSGDGGRQALAALATYGDRLRGAVAIDPPGDAQSLGLAGTLLRPALLVRLQGDAAGAPGNAEQLLWRMRASRREAAYLAVDAQKCAPDCRGAQAAARAAIGGYLAGLLGAGAVPESGPAAAATAPLSATPAP